jgi:mRNA interferase MazF
VTYESFDVIVVPFPFTDRDTSKRRPALVLSKSSFHEVDHSVCSMITTKNHSPWPGDTEITDLDAAGLDHPSLIRLKLFTLDHRLIVKMIGALAKHDQNSVKESLRQHLI